MSNSLKLTFLTAAHDKATLNIPNPNKNVTDQQVKDAMTAIIASGAVMMQNSALESRFSAELQDVTEKEFNI